MISTMPQRDFWVRSFEISFDQGWFCSLQAIAYDTARHQVAVGGDGGKVSIFHLATGKIMETVSVNDKIRTLCFSTSDEIFVGTEYGSIACLSAQTGMQDLIQKVSDKAITSLAFHPSQGLLVGADDCKLRLVDPRTLMVNAISPNEGSYVQAVAFTDDGSHALSAGFDNCFRIYKLPDLRASEILYKGEDSQREAVAGHGIYVCGSKDGIVSIMDENDLTRLTCLPVSDQDITSVLIAKSRYSLMTVDQKGRVQEWSLKNLKPVSALDSELIAKEAAISENGDVCVICSESKIAVYLRSSALAEYKALQEYKDREKSLQGLLMRLIRWLFRLPTPVPPSDRGLPLAAAEMASRVSVEDLEHESSLSELLISCYESIAETAKKVNWREVSRTLEKYQRAELENQKLELRKIREQRLEHAANEARRMRELREEVLRERKETARKLERLEAERREEAQRRSGSFWRGLSRALMDSGSTSQKGAGNRTKQVSSYVRKDGTRVRSYKRR